MSVGSDANATVITFVSTKSKLIFVVQTLNENTKPVQVIIILKLFKFRLRLFIVTKVVSGPSYSLFINIYYPRIAQPPLYCGMLFSHFA